LIFGSIATIRGNESSILSVLIDLDFDNSINENFSIKKDKISFKKSITLQDIDFKYNIDGDFVINKLNICIKKGERIGVVGTTGSGKSTLIDIIMQLLEPTSGKLLIDNVEINKLNYQSWQSHISHVPQFIFLSDASILENIAFGVDIDNIDFERVVYSAKKAKISETIETWEKKYNTSIGERGVRISGGQRQRIGIARAFYKNAELIILDEATSALDSETENEIMRSINDFDRNLTILIIAHRVATLQKCDRIIDLSNKDIFIHDSFEEYQKSIIK
jgi:ATP-binding cassette subfamily B protein